MLHSASANPSPGRRGSALISSQNNPGGIEYECVNCGESFDDQGLAAAHIPQCSQTSNNEDKDRIQGESPFQN
uniref:C2H2-type domain-containing protein n=1 Tax=Bursaphelenchus xylophilus TaxID=6326 RepID=A0A1I7SH87_BURXY